ncbi:hypothetical protein B0H16DRAFT_1428811 [Mycena metata]|uniref:Uncharacterized protein n=1 Tax=Mycena metata TaxID=1033252 RepID=A0AAD7HTG1_9AGAR|nr:hypothetical protein B0H16DRAFT_1428811 [Mycena metata]
MSASATEGSQPTDSPPDTETVLQKAGKRFLLHNPIEATDALWRAYSNNRLAAWTIRKSHKKAEQAGYESPDSDDDENMRLAFSRNDTIYVLRSIRRTLRELEDEMGLPDTLLQKSVAVLDCDAGFEEADDPRTVSTISRIYSPSRPVYVDVHLLYHCRMRYDHLEWHFSIGYKIHSRPQGRGPAKEIPADLDIKTLNDELGGGLANMHVNKGWRSIAWATWDDLGGTNFGQRRVEQRSFDLYDEGIIDLHEAFFGPLPEPDGASDLARRQASVAVVRLLLAAVGIDYDIACEEDEDDAPPGRDQLQTKQGHIAWMLSGLSDHWMAREVRKACGFQLARDPVEQAAGDKEREEERTRELDYYDDDEDPAQGCRPQ